MKRLFPLLVLMLIAVQFFLMPVSAGAIVDGEECPFIISITTLPATDITLGKATLNANVSLVFVDGLFRAGGEEEETPLVFQYGTEPGVYTHEVPAEIVYDTEIEDGISAVLKASIQDLTLCTRYYVRLKCYVLLDDVGSSGIYFDNARGVGVGLDGMKPIQMLYYQPGFHCQNIYYGNEISFISYGCQILQGFDQTGGTGGPSNSNPVTSPPNIVVQSATVATAKIAPGEVVNVAATATNKGGSNGVCKITLYVNGQEVESKGITLSSGETKLLSFTISRNEPGTYNVYVNNAPAGSFTVDAFSSNDALIYGVIGLFSVGILGVIYLLVKRRTA